MKRKQVTRKLKDGSNTFLTKKATAKAQTVRKLSKNEETGL